MLADQVNVAYRGTLQQWQAFLHRRDLLPDALSRVSLEAAPTWTLRTPRFQMTVPPTLVKLDSHSRLSLAMSYDAGTTKTTWAVAGAWWYQDSEEQNYVALWRQPRPPTGARQELQNAYSDMQNQTGAYNGQPVRSSPGAITLTGVLQAVGTKAGTASADVLYPVEVGIGGDLSIASIADRQELARTSARILEHGVGADVTMLAPAPDLKSRMDAYINQYREMMTAYDAIYGRDIRNRTVSQDFTDYLAAVYHKTTLDAGSFAKLTSDVTSRAKALQDYWRLVPAVTHNSNLWPSFLARNGMTADRPHNAEVIAAEAALRQELAAGDPNPRWAELASALVHAYVAERQRLVTSGAARTANATLRPRDSNCPPPAPKTSGHRLPILQPLKSSLAEFYPTQMRRWGVEGTVMLEILIDEHGCVQRRVVVGSSGSDELDEAAVRWVETASFLPAEKDGHAVAYTATLPMNFALNN